MDDAAHARADTAQPEDADQLAQLLEYVQQQADAERGALAAALHDELGGLLVGMKMELAALSPALGTAQQPHLEGLRRALGAAIALRQRLEERLQPGLLVHVGLFAALRSYADQPATGTSLHVELPAAELPFKPAVRIVLYRALLSALAHVSAGGAPGVRMRGSIVGPLLEVAVDRTGERSPGTASADPALQAAQRRVACIGGSLDGSTNSVRLRLPLAAQLLLTPQK
ncbi:MAG: hypothetical protein JOZ67_12590 [Gammaproteobacteria bacterium]|nr:hypothetical protein [Gammaproteobacteria bacterium]